MHNSKKWLLSLQSVVCRGLFSLLNVVASSSFQGFAKMYESLLEPHHGIYVKTTVLFSEYKVTNRLHVACPWDSLKIAKFP